MLVLFHSVKFHLDQLEKNWIMCNCMGASGWACIGGGTVLPALGRTLHIMWCRKCIVYFLTGSHVKLSAAILDRTDAVVSVKADVNMDWTNDTHTVYYTTHLLNSYSYNAILMVDRYYLHRLWYTRMSIKNRTKTYTKPCLCGDVTSAFKLCTVQVLLLCVTIS